ncbi:serine hydrolase domain-containing protein [Candidatus Palauibacter sp.]|uniref:serine hydrolase domain-containing protein n=1 Tax=Candidatus Palauibacter sp. TaxID=3101350 RepID=UPI003B5AB378
MTVHRSIRTWALSLVLSLCVALQAATALAAQSYSYEGLLDYMEQVRNENDLPGLSVAVAVDGEIVFSEGVGYAELDNRTPATGRTVHNVGSVSKVLAVVGLMQLVEQGEVDLDATLQTYMPWYPEREHPITVRHILTHTSGIRHYNGVEFGPHDLLRLRHYDDFREATELWRDDPLAYETGSGWMYSSHAHNLQHGIVEAASGMDYEEYLKRFVWEPAGMMATQFDVPSRVVQNRGHGYVRGESGRFIHPPPEDPSYKYAGGGIISNVDDLVRFALAINDGRLLGPETVAEMHRPQLETGIRQIDPSTPDGLGEPIAHEQALAWFIRTDQAGRRYPSHTGTVKGTRSFLGNWNDYGVVVAIQTNALPFDSARYGEAIAQMFLP